MVKGLVRSTIGDPDLRSPSGFDSGLRPPLRMTRRGRGGVLRLVRSTIGDPDLRSPSGFDSGLSPSAQDDTEGRGYAISLLGQPLCMVAPAVFINI